MTVINTKIKTEVYCECGNTFGNWYLWDNNDFHVKCENCGSIYRIKLNAEKVND